MISNANKFSNTLHSFSQSFMISFYQLDIFPFIRLQYICRELSVVSASYIDTFSRLTILGNSHLVNVLTDLLDAFTPTPFATVPFCNDLPCGPDMSLDESNFGPPESARRMQFTPHIDYLNTSQFEVQQPSLQRLTRFMRFIFIAEYHHAVVVFDLSTVRRLIIHMDIICTVK